MQKSYVTLVLDESGSMGIAHRQTVSGVNEQIQAIKAAATPNIETLVTLITFNGSYRIQFKNEPVENVQELDMSDYRPSGSTALYDAIGLAIDILESSPGINDADTSVLLIVVSDGEENASKLTSAKQVKERLEMHQDAGNWTVTYMGANVDVKQVAGSLGVPLGNVAAFSSATAADYGDAFGTTTVALSNYMSARNAGTLRSATFYDEVPAPKTEAANPPLAQTLTPDNLDAFRQAIGRSTRDVPTRNVFTVEVGDLSQARANLDQLVAEAKAVLDSNKTGN